MDNLITDTCYKKWTKDEDSRLKEAVKLYGDNNYSWIRICEHVGTRNNDQCRQRWHQSLRPGITKGKWTMDEDMILRQAVLKYDTNWIQISEKLPGRSAKQCRERWLNRLSPKLNKSKFTEEEDNQILELHSKFGNLWAKIASIINTGRTENMIRTRYHKLTKFHKREANETDAFSISEMSCEHVKLEKDTTTNESIASFEKLINSIENSKYLKEYYGENGQDWKKDFDLPEMVQNQDVSKTWQAIFREFVPASDLRLCNPYMFGSSAHNFSVFYANALNSQPLFQSFQDTPISAHPYAYGVYGSIHANAAHGGQWGFNVPKN